MVAEFLDGRVVMLVVGWSLYEWVQCGFVWGGQRMWRRAVRQTLPGNRLPCAVKGRESYEQSEAQLC